MTNFRHQNITAFGGTREAATKLQTSPKRGTTTEWAPFYTSYLNKDNNDSITAYLKSLPPRILYTSATAVGGNNKLGFLNSLSKIESFTLDLSAPSNQVFIPPLNTDIRFGGVLPYHSPTKFEKLGISATHGSLLLTNRAPETFLSPKAALKGGRFAAAIKREVFDGKTPYIAEHYVHPADVHPRELHIHSDILKDFSWAVVTPEDSPLDKHKKKLIKTVPSLQYACGSCWAISFADVMSDCLVVSGAVNWSPHISATYIMTCVPTIFKNSSRSAAAPEGGDGSLKKSETIHDACAGGNPAVLAKYLEGVGVADTSCVDYSWCTNNPICTNVDSSQHFSAAKIANTLKRSIPKPCGCFFSDSSKYMYKINPGSESFYINDTLSIDDFRNTVKSHILDYGPVIGGFVILENFISGNHSNINNNGGVYFDRADYSSVNTIRREASDDVRGAAANKKLTFNDRMVMQTAGLHAVSIVGWGVAHNIQYDNDKWGDVPYWHCRNSWGSSWGDGGFFRCAMFPFNQTAQFDKQIMTSVGGPVGSMVLIRATEKPTIVKYDQIDPVYNEQIKHKLRADTYYKADPLQVKLLNQHKVLSQVVDNNTEQNSKYKEASKVHGINICLLLILLCIIISIFCYML
jgi:hypothetical protein